MAETSTAGKVQFELVTPERLLASEAADMVVAPGAAGDFGVLPLHSPLLSLLRPGVIEIYQGARVARKIFVGGGFAEVNEQGCVVLAEEALPVSEIDLEAARRRLADAQDDLREATTDAERTRYEHEIAIAEAQIAAV